MMLSRFEFLDVASMTQFIFIPMAVIHRNAPYIVQIYFVAIVSLHPVHVLWLRFLAAFVVGAATLETSTWSCLTVGRRWGIGRRVESLGGATSSIKWKVHFHKFAIRCFLQTSEQMMMLKFKYVC